MSNEILRVLACWPIASRGGEATRVTTAQGFSGAEVWRIQADQQSFALRQWPESMHADRLQQIHSIQRHLAEHGPPVIPRLQTTGDGATAACLVDRLWELATWMPGVADFDQDPSSARLDAAMRTLAVIHCTTEFMPAPLSGQFGRQVGLPSKRGSASLAKRVCRLTKIVGGELRIAQSNVARGALAEHRGWLLDAISLVEALAPRELAAAEKMRTVELPLQFRLGDIHHDHVLFTGDNVTGIVDFGAVDYDSPAGDVARLLGSLVGDDRERWRRGLDAYLAVRPLSEMELSAVDLFDSSGVVVSAANWIGWLWGDADQRLPLLDKTRPLARLSRLAGRLTTLAKRRDCARVMDQR